MLKFIIDHFHFFESPFSFLHSTRSMTDITIWQTVMKTPTQMSFVKMERIIEPNVVTSDVTKYVLLSYTQEKGRRCAPKTIAKSMNIASGFWENAHITIRR